MLKLLKIIYCKKNDVKQLKYLLISLFKWDSAY